jgi:hypothetical protein
VRREWYAVDLQHRQLHQVGSWEADVSRNVKVKGQGAVARSTAFRE